MLIIKRKQFALILSFLVLSFGIYFAQDKNTQNRSYDIMQVSSIPVTNKVIVVDAGHGGEDRAVLLIVMV